MYTQREASRQSRHPRVFAPTGIIGTNCEWKMALFTKAPKLWYLNWCKRTCFERSTPTTLVENRTYVWHVKFSFGQECMCDEYLRPVWPLCTKRINEILTNTNRTLTDRQSRSLWGGKAKILTYCMPLLWLDRGRQTRRYLFLNSHRKNKSSLCNIRCSGHLPQW